MCKSVFSSSVLSESKRWIPSRCCNVMDTGIRWAGVKLVDCKFVVIASTQEKNGMRLNGVYKVSAEG